jgi:hypothetical protein
VKRLLLVAVLGALVAGATGCDLSPPAATVNDASISQSTLNAVLASAVGTTTSASNARCAEQIQSGSDASPLGVGTESDGTTPNAVSSAFAADQLEELILQQLERQTLAARHTTVTRADVTAATADYESQLQEQQSQEGSPPGCTLTTSASLSSQLPRAYLHQRATSLADQEMFEVAVGHVDLSTAALQAYYTQHIAEVTQECLNLVITDSASAAQTIHDQIAGGTSFASASTSASADTQLTPSGGELQCLYPSEISGQFGTALGTTIDDLSAGQLAPPQVWQTENSSTGAAATYYLIVQMRAHQVVPFAALRDQIREVVLEQHSAVVGKSLNSLVARAHITVDPRYGTWNSKRGVTVPTPPPPAFVLTPKVDQPPASTSTAATPGSVGAVG